MPRNKLGDLNNLLFEAMERLNDTELTGEALREEMERAHAMKGVAEQVIANGALALKAYTVQSEYAGEKLALPDILGG